MCCVTGGDVFGADCFAAGNVWVSGSTIAEEDCASEGIELDASDCYVIPGLIDLHFHGCMGDDLSDASAEGLHRMAAYEAKRGITAICPASMTLPHDRLMAIMGNVGVFEAKVGEAELVGMNMEGPYISPDKVGAQNPEYVRAASIEEFTELQQAAHGRIKLVDVAPEEPGNLDFIREMHDKVRISLAHMCADYDTAKNAFEAGARHMTHLFNAMPSLHHRKPGPIAAGAEAEGVTPEIITDGVHVHPDRVIIISDSLRCCGLEDGEYELGGQNFTLNGRRCTLADGTLAGSASDQMACLRTAVTEMNIPLHDAVRAASTNPARALGVADRYGSLSPTHTASLVLLDKTTLEVKHVILRGKLLV